MLTFRKTGKKIARIAGGKFDGKSLYIYDPDYKCCKKCSEKCKNKKGKKICCDKCRFNKKGGCCNGGNIEFDDKDTFDSINLSDDDGKIVPVPKQNKYEADHYYVAGQTDAGKSTAVSEILDERPLEEKTKDIFIFSTFEKDDALDHLNPTRILIDSDMIDDPIQKEELQDSYVIFDDIDRIRPSKLAKACRDLRDDLLENGRKMGIKVFSTSHQIMDYKKTRDCLNSTQKIIIFPQATSPHHINRFLKSYIGLDKKQIAEIMGIKTRRLLFSTNYPRYMLWDKGCTIINKINDPDAKEVGKDDSDSESEDEQEIKVKKKKSTTTKKTKKINYK